MNNTNYHFSFHVPITPDKVFDAITRVKEWWTVNADGNTRAVGEEFTVQFEDVHLTRQLITEAKPGERIVWRVIESHLPWLNDPEEWKDTDMMFEITPTPEGSHVTFTHIGLTPKGECFDQCEKGWNYFLGTSLFKLIMEGAGLPDTSERKHFDTIGHVSSRND